MKILCQAGNAKHETIYSGWRRVCEAAGHSFRFWRADQPAFDAFDEASPNLFIQTGPPTRGLQRCLEGRRGILVVRRPDPTPAFDSILCAGATERPHLSCQVAFVGNYSVAKAPYLLPLAERFHIKVFGATAWPLNEYLGPVDEATIPDIYRSATICLNVSSDPTRMSERVYQICGMGCICFSNTIHCSNLPVVMSSGKLADDLQQLLDDVGKQRGKEIRKQGSRAVLAEHTYFHRVADMFSEVALAREAAALMEVYRALQSV